MKMIPELSSATQNETSYRVIEFFLKWSSTAQQLFSQNNFEKMVISEKYEMANI